MTDEPQGTHPAKNWRFGLVVGVSIGLGIATSREVEKALVLEVAFDAIQPSTRHKSGLAMRFPRISRIRLDKPAGEADQIVALERLIAQS